MASIQTLPRNKFIITLDDGSVINGQYGTWAYKRFCEKRGVKLPEAIEQLKSYELHQDMTVLTDYIMSAVEQSFYEKNDTVFPYKEVHLCSWIDELGGVGSANFTKLVNPSESDTGDEKKSQENPPIGQS